MWCSERISSLQDSDQRKRMSKSSTGFHQNLFNSINFIQIFHSQRRKELLVEIINSNIKTKFASEKV